MSISGNFCGIKTDGNDTNIRYYIGADKCAVVDDSRILMFSPQDQSSQGYIDFRDDAILAWNLDDYKLQELHEGDDILKIIDEETNNYNELDTQGE